MEFRKYQHVERLGTTSVEGITLGECYCFPKLDGTNASVWLGKDGDIQAGSRNRSLTLDSDNAGFFQWLGKQVNIIAYLRANPSHRLFGEWLVPHSLKSYRSAAWRNFYVFDVCIDKANRGDSEPQHMHYLEYKPLLEKYSIEYIPAIAVVRNGSYQQFTKILKNNDYLIEGDEGNGEGVVIKNYEFKNRFGHQIWAKLITSEFKERHSRVMGVSKINEEKLIEEEIVEKYVTKALIEKEKAKIDLEDGWSSRFIPRLLNTVYYSLVKEESWNFVKDYKNPTIDFSRLKHFTVEKIKTVLPEIFS